MREDRRGACEGGGEGGDVGEKDGGWRVEYGVCV